MSVKAIDAVCRLQRAYERLGSYSPRCVNCGEDDPHCLENHHVAGRKADEGQIPICRNCHRKLSDTQKDQPKTVGRKPEPMEQIGLFLLGVADLFELLISKLREFGNALMAGVREGKACKGASTGKTGAGS